MAKIIAIANQKGGVGKTTTTVNLAAALVQKGYKVLCVDLDPQANLSDYLGFVPREEYPTISELMENTARNKPVQVAIWKNTEGIHFIPSSLSLAGADMYLAMASPRERILQKILEQPAVQAYDFILIDCLPSLGILLTNALVASDGVLIPVQTQKFSLSGLTQLNTVINMVKTNFSPRLSIYGILPTMAENNNHSKSVETVLNEQYPSLVFTHAISRRVEASNSTFLQHSMVIDPGSQLGKQYIQTAEELLERGI